jgi:hypothetical protein
MAHPAYAILEGDASRGREAVGRRQNPECLSVQRQSDVTQELRNSDSSSVDRGTATAPCGRQVALKHVAPDVAHYHVPAAALARVARPFAPASFEGIASILASTDGRRPHEHRIIITYWSCKAALRSSRSSSRTSHFGSRRCIHHRLGRSRTPRLDSAIRERLRRSQVTVGHLTDSQSRDRFQTDSLFGPTISGTIALEILRQRGDSHGCRSLGRSALFSLSTWKHQRSVPARGHVSAGRRAIPVVVLGRMARDGLNRWLERAERPSNGQVIHRHRDQR